MGEYETCENCGFDGSLFNREALLPALDTLGGAWRDHLYDAGPLLRVRPAPQIWSALEYATHSRDVTSLHLAGVREALTAVEPDYGTFDGDALLAAAAATYADADPDDVVVQLTRDAKELATVAREAPVRAWQFGLTVNGERRTVRRLLEHALHDSLHHLIDIERNLVQLRH